MDGQNFSNEHNNYQDNTANMQYQMPPESNEPSGPNGCQIAGLVLGIIGIPACCCYGIPGILFGVIGIILAIVGNKRNKGSGVGIGGLVCSIIALIFGILATIYYGLILQGMAGAGPFAEMIEEMGYNLY